MLESVRNSRESEVNPDSFRNPFNDDVHDHFARNDPNHSIEETDIGMPLKENNTWDICQFALNSFSKLIYQAVILSESC